MRRTFASVVAVVAVAGLIGAATHGHAQNAPPPAAKAKTPAKKAPAKSEQEGDADAAPAAKKKRDPAEAQRQIESGIKLFQEGKAEPAIQMLTSATSGGGLPPQQMARAVYYRGMAYRKAAKPAQAISDLTSALWLKNGLAEADRTEALKQRSEAYREAGLPDQTDSDGKAPGVKGNTKAASAGDAKSATPAPATSGNFLASLFGQKSPPPPPPAEPAAAAPLAPAAAPASHEPATSGWSSKTKPTKTQQPANAAAALVSADPPPAAEPPPAAKSSRQRAAAASPAAAPAPAASPGPAPAAKADGKFRARVALVRSRADAEAIVARLRVQHAAAVGNAATEINEASFGNMGTFFQVRVGPFAHEADATGVCAKLKGSGLDCVPVDR